MVTQVGSFILVYVECKVAIPMVSTRKTDDDHHVADSEAIGRLRHELIKSTGNPRISSGVKLSNSTSSSSKQTSLCIAALATVSDGELSLRFMSRLGTKKNSLFPITC